MDGQPVVEGQARVTVARIGGCPVLLQSRGEHRERVSEALQESQHVFRREHVLHHHEAHQVEAEVTRDRGGFRRCVQPGRVDRPAGLGGLVDAAMPGWLATRAGWRLSLDQPS